MTTNTSLTDQGTDPRNGVDDHRDDHRDGHGMENSHQGAAGTSDSPASSAQDRTVTFKGERLEIPRDLWNEGEGRINGAAAVQQAIDLRRQLSQKPGAPETYEITIPDELRDQLKVDPNDPLVQSAMGWAKKHSMSQEAFGELTSLFYEQEAQLQQQLIEEYEDELDQVKQVLGKGAKQRVNELMRWSSALVQESLGEDDPAVQEALGEILSTKTGILLFNNIQNGMRERPIPSANSYSSERGMTRHDLRTLQNSAAYQDNNHPDHKVTVAKVRRGYQQLFPESKNVT